MTAVFCFKIHQRVQELLVEEEMVDTGSFRVQLGLTKVEVQQSSGGSRWSWEGGSSVS